MDGIELRRGDVPGADLDPDPRRARVRGRPPAPVRARPARTAAPAPRAPGGARRGRHAGLPRRDAARPGCRVDRRARARRPRRPAGRDHRAGRAQDDDQRAQFGRQRVHGRPRGRAVADVGQRRRRPGRAARRDPADAHVRIARGQVLPARREDRDARRPAARLAPGRVGDARRRRAGLGVAVRLRAVPVPQRRRGAAAGERAVPLPRQARIAPRGAALERGLHPRPDRARHPARDRSGRPS